MSTTRTYMLEFPNGEIAVQRYLSAEAEDVFGAEAVKLMRDGAKAIVHFPRCPNVFVIDLVQTGLARLGRPLDTKVRD